jgi:hypothetical protein
MSMTAPRTDVLTKATVYAQVSLPILDLRIFKTILSMNTPILIHAQAVGRTAFEDSRIVKRELIYTR